MTIEKEQKRTREIKYGPRIIDLDILFFDDIIINNNNLTIPHPHIQERKFILVPLAEIEPDLIHPILKKSIKDILKDLDTEDKVHLYNKH